MKKIAIALALSFAFVTPTVLACPHEDKTVKDTAKPVPQTAEKGKKAEDGKKDTTKKDTAKTDTAKKGDDGKVSSK